MQTIKIGGSKDRLYPVWWRFPSQEGGPIGRITITRHYALDSAEQPLNDKSIHQASLMLDIEGWGHPWGGDPHIFNILNFKEMYNGTCSHPQFCMKSIKHPIDVGKP